jgi:phosphate starvation-inducible protein PhoH
MTDNGANGHKADIPENEQPQDEDINIAAEFAALGRKFGDAISTTLRSEEAQRIEGEVRKGLRSFTDEVEARFKSAKDTQGVKKANESVKKATQDLENSQVMTEAREGLLAALRSLSRALDDMARGLDEQEAKAEATEEKPTE